MRRLFLTSLTALAALVACNKVTPEVLQEDREFTDLEINIGGLIAQVETKASTTNNAGTYETKINSVSLAIFDGTSFYKLETATSATKTVSLRTGRTYTVCAVVNGPSINGKTTIDAIEAVSTTLGSDNSVGDNGDMVMYGKATMSAPLSSSNKTITVNVKRRVCRIHLVSCSVTVPQGGSNDNYKFTSAYISNVPTVCSLGGTVTLNSTNCDNWYGRNPAGEANKIGDGTHTAQDASLTYSTSSSNAWFYAYPNNNTDKITAWQSTWAATATRLVVAAKWNGTIMYYPVPIPNTVLNTTYDVTLTITGPGNTDPQGPVPSNSNLDVTINVDPWGQGQDYPTTY